MDVAPSTSGPGEGRPGCEPRSRGPRAGPIRRTSTPAPRTSAARRGSAGASRPRGQSARRPDRAQSFANSRNSIRPRSSSAVSRWRRPWQTARRRRFDAGAHRRDRAGPDLVERDPLLARVEGLRSDREVEHGAASAVDAREAREPAATGNDRLGVSLPAVAAPCPASRRSAGSRSVAASRAVLRAPRPGTPRARGMARRGAGRPSVSGEASERTLPSATCASSGEAWGSRRRPRSGRRPRRERAGLGHRPKLGRLGGRTEADGAGRGASLRRGPSLQSQASPKAHASTTEPSSAYQRESISAGHRAPGTRSNTATWPCGRAFLSRELSPGHPEAGQPRGRARHRPHGVCETPRDRQEDREARAGLDRPPLTARRGRRPPPGGPRRRSRRASRASSWPRRRRRQARRAGRRRRGICAGCERGIDRVAKGRPSPARGGREPPGRRATAPSPTTEQPKPAHRGGRRREPLVSRPCVRPTLPA